MVDVYITVLSIISNLPRAEAPLTTTKVMFGLLAFLLVYLGLYSISFILFGVAQHVAKRTKTNLDDELIIALQVPVHYATLLAAFFVFTAYLFPELTFIGYPFIYVFKLLFILLAAFTLNRLVKTTVNWYYADPTAKSNVKLTEEAIPLVSKSISIVIYLTASILMLNQLGVEVGPLLAGLGIAGLAVALALQDSLANLFAGLYLLADKPVRVGDFIKLEGGDEGHVQEIGWRSTRIKTLSNNIVILPNNKLATSVITNYALPNQQSIAEVVVGVSYDSDPEKVERALIAAVGNIRKKHPDVISEATPTVRFSEFADSTLTFKLFVPVLAHTLKWEAAHLVRKEIMAEFKRSNIDIPFPIRTIYMKKG